MTQSAFIQRCLKIGWSPIRASPHVERRLVLICGVLLLCGCWWAWVHFLVMLNDVQIWSGPDDPYGLPLLLWMLIGIVALGPIAPRSWRNRRWPAKTWLAVAIALCFGYSFIGSDLLMMPLDGRFNPPDHHGPRIEVMLPPSP